MILFPGVPKNLKMQFIRSLSRSAVSYLQGGGGGGPGTENDTETAANTFKSTDRSVSRQLSLASNVQEVAEKARAIIVDWKPLNCLKLLFAGFPLVSEVMNNRDGSGYTLLQHAIICRRAAVVQWLVTQGAELNSPICGRPLHLAAKLGQSDILKLLLDYNADPFVVSCVCYPEKHEEARMVYSSHGQRWYTTCVGDIFQEGKLIESQFEYPFYYAILADSVECVKLLFHHSAIYLKSNLPYLHLACQLGAIKCVRYFCETKPEMQSILDGKLLTPLQYGVHWGKGMVEYLVLHGASVTVKTKSDESLLHLLCGDRTNSIGLSDTVDYLITCGLKVGINGVDGGGNSVAHALHGSLHRHCPTPWESEDENLSVEEMEYLTTLDLLLKAGLNPNIVNRAGDTAFHVLCRVQNKMVKKLGMAHVRLRLVQKLMQRLLEGGANPNLVSNSDATILGSFIEYSTNAVFFQTATTFTLPTEEDLEWLIKCIETLARHKCVFDTCRHLYPVCLMHHVIGHLEALDKLTKLHYMHQEQQELAKSWLTAVIRVANVLMVSGFKPNTCKFIETDLHSAYYKIIPHHQILPLDLLTELMLIFLRYGANPNVGGKHIPMSVCRYSSSSSYWHIYPLLHVLNLIGARDVAAQQADLFTLFRIFYNSMDMSSAKQCIFHYLEYDWANKKSCKNLHFQEHLVNLLDNPSSLRHICASYIFTHIAKRNIVKLRTLPLPCTLVNFISNFQY